MTKDNSLASVDEKRVEFCEDELAAVRIAGCGMAQVRLTLSRGALWRSRDKMAKTTNFTQFSKKRPF